MTVASVNRDHALDAAVREAAETAEYIARTLARLRRHRHDPLQVGVEFAAVRRLARQLDTELSDVEANLPASGGAR